MAKAAVEEKKSTKFLWTTNSIKTTKQKLEIATDMIKEVRKETRAETLDCKDTLLTAKGDAEKAILIIRE